MLAKGKRLLQTENTFNKVAICFPTDFINTDDPF